MEKQNYSNHRRLVFGFHFITFSLIILLLISSTYSLYASIRGNYEIRYSIMFLITTLIFISLFLYSRSFSLKAQDRAIRAEENLRHFVLTRKLIDPKLTMSQIIALRFAPDEEYIELAQKAVNENLSSTEIKKSVKNWKSDNHRV